MNKKGILKIKSNNKERMMHYLFIDNKIQILSLDDTDLIDDIKKNNEIELTFHLKKEVDMKALVTIVEDKEKVKELYYKMLEEKTSYFKEYDERLIILEINLLK